MKKFLKLGATFTLLGALFVGCIDNNVDASIIALRTAKAEVMKTDSETRRLLAQAEVKRVEAEAARLTAVAKVADADAAYRNAEAEWLRAKTQADKDRWAEELRLLKAENDKLINDELLAMEAANREAKLAEQRYLKELAQLEADLINLKDLLKNQLEARYISELQVVMQEIRYYIGDRDGFREDVLDVQAQIFFYENVDVTLIKEKLDHMVEKTGYAHEKAKWVLDAWTKVKNLAVEEYAVYAKELIALKGEAQQEIVKANLTLTQEKTKLVPLKKAYDDAKAAYEGGFTWTVGIPDVFDATATDFPFSMGKSGDVRLRSGVRDNVYGIYSHPENRWVSTAIGAAEAIGWLDKDIKFIQNRRIFQGVEGIQNAQEQLATREKTAADTKKAYEDGLANWKKLYAAGDAGASAQAITWAASKELYTNTKALYEKTYGTAFAIPANAKPGADPYNASEITSSFDQNKASMNYLYTYQKYLIEQYTYIIKTLIAGGSIPGFSLNDAKLISDVLGGIYFNPGKLVELILGSNNFETLNTIFKTVQTVAACIDIVEMFKALQPSYYQLSSVYQGGVYKAPIMEKYNITSSVEYHAWFLLYILFEGNQIKVGDDILVIGSGYDNVNAKLADDFLGFHTNNYPGRYNFITSKDVNFHATEGDFVAKNRIVSELNASGSAAAAAYEYKFPLLVAMLNADKALATAWNNWGGIVTSLNKEERDLFTPYYRVWSTKNYGTGDLNGLVTSPSYVKDNPATAAIDKSKPLNPGATGHPVDPDTYPPSFGGPFWFRPELITDRTYPSLTPGVDIYWDNYYNRVTNPDGYGYFSILAYRTSLVGVDWMRWQYYGRPVYNDDPVLWVYDGWDNNANLPVSKFAAAIVAQRNYDQYQFWYDQQAKYQELITKLGDEKALIAAKVASLKQVMDEAYIPYKAQKDVVDALELQISNAEDMIAEYDNVLTFLTSNVFDAEWARYDAAFHAYQTAEEAYKLALANRSFFDTYGGYAKIENDVTLRNEFVGNVLINLNSLLDIYRNHIEEATLMLNQLEKQKADYIEKLKNI